mmetsp:Transcript_40226/g.110600  ORF Transcript_40226/g.110600 Transcript_40226/m.110600 type:complete len:251 (+) Transcript_40226:1501-2253(+)
MLPLLRHPVVEQMVWGVHPQLYRIQPVMQLGPVRGWHTFRDVDWLVARFLGGRLDDTAACTLAHGPSGPWCNRRPRLHVRLLLQRQSAWLPDRHLPFAHRQGALRSAHFAAAGRIVHKLSAEMVLPRVEHFAVLRPACRVFMALVHPALPRGCSAPAREVALLHPVAQTGADLRNRRSRLRLCKRPITAAYRSVSCIAWAMPGDAHTPPRCRPRRCSHSMRACVVIVCVKGVQESRFLLRKVSGGARPTE